MPNILEIVERLRGLKTDLDATQAKKVSENKLLRLEQNKKDDEERKVWEDKRKTLEKNFKPILESVNTELLRGEGTLKEGSSPGKNPTLALEWGSVYQQGGQRPLTELQRITRMEPNLWSNSGGMLTHIILVLVKKIGKMIFWNQ